LIDCTWKEDTTIMTHLVLTIEQARVVREAAEPLEVRDEQGRTLAYLTPLLPEDIEAIEQSKRHRGVGGPRVSADQVEAHMRRLAEIRQVEGMTEPKMLELLRRLRAGE
jgi:hypothetical protein